jgi:hypothetical protein
MRNENNISVGKPEENYYLRDLSVDGRKISAVGSCEHCNQYLGFIKQEEFSD